MNFEALVTRRARVDKTINIIDYPIIKSKVGAIHELPYPKSAPRKDAMKIDLPKHHRQSIRVPDYDYSQPGAYFITIVTYGREPLFGEIVGGEMRLNAAGQIVWDVWQSLPARFPPVNLGTAVVMPNHFHGIIEIDESVGAIPNGMAGAIHELPLPSPRPESSERRRTERRRMTLPLVVGYFKMNAAKRIHQNQDSANLRIWQRNYYEHIIRNEQEYRRIHVYIESNVDHWARDGENLGNQK